MSGRYEYSEWSIHKIGEDISSVAAMAPTLAEGGVNIGQGVLDRLQAAATTLHAAYPMARLADRLLSGDCSEEEFIRRWDDEVGKLSAEGAE
jgi:hypothetical protein